jgi:hypothetical protein
MFDRYSSRKIFKNDLEQYDKTFRDRNVSYIRHYSTPSFSELTTEQLKSIDTVQHIWSVGDRYSKLAHEYYGDIKLWWIIAKFNHKPTESHLVAGDIIYIPVPIQNVIKFMLG